MHNLGAWEKGMDWEVTGKKQFQEELKNQNESAASKRQMVPEFVNFSKVNPENKYKFKSYVVDICRDVSRRLAENPPKNKYQDGLSKQNISDAFGSLNVSNDFKEFCTQVLLELIYNLGSILRVILRTRKDRTVDKNLVVAVIGSYHISFNEADNLNKTKELLNKMPFSR